MPELSTSEELRLADATSTFFRLISLDRVWTTVGRRPGLNTHDVSVLNSVVDQMNTLVRYAVEAAREIVTLAIQASPPAGLPDLTLLDPTVSQVFQSLLNRDGGVIGIAQQSYNTLSKISEQEVIEINRQMNILQEGGHIEADLSRRFMCNLAKSLMAAGGVTIWVPPHVHAVASISAGAAIYNTNRCWEMEPAV